MKIDPTNKTLTINFSMSFNSRNSLSPLLAVESRLRDDIEASLQQVSLLEIQT
jgi:hypothetical protein